MNRFNDHGLNNPIGRRAVLGAGALGGAVLLPGAAAAPAKQPCLAATSYAFENPPEQAKVSELLVEVGDGVSLWCWDTGGEGAPIILLHPGTGSGAIWRYQQPVFHEHGYRVIGYSRRGHYKSSPGSADNPGYAVDDLDKVRDALGVDEFHLVATAAGGFIAPDYALSYGERLLSLVISCSLGGVVEPAFQKWSRAIMPEGFRSMPASFREIGPDYRAANPAGVAQWEALEEIAHSGPRIRQHARNELTWINYGRIKTPTLLAAGAADLLAPAPVMREIAARIPDADFAVLPYAGHSGYWERPDLFNVIVLDWIGRHSA